ncbi:MAG TPA: response regulator [Campylobacterales bacterium]|nr:response regulator [Campylobacterales bacterium]
MIDKLKILVVDDSLSARMLLKSAFSESIKKNSYFFEASNGEEAVEIFKQENPNIIFMDLTMPKMNGMEALQEIKKISPEAIVVMVTADRQKETKKELVAAGAANVLNKPVDEDELREICAKIAFGG